VKPILSIGQDVVDRCIPTSVI